MIVTTIFASLMLSLYNDIFDNNSSLYFCVIIGLIYT